LRSAEGLTIEHLAAHAELTAEHLERIEDGLRDPTWTTLHRLAVALDTTAALLAYAIEVEKP
jgi:transcriptional regulator with XRE-family HTH domain